ncbi:MAG: hypothetical protein IKJ73_03445 [Lachnospiraceae bacterium]|nr:hypothetical protein [Lachnospiraceae bacterium]
MMKEGDGMSQKIVQGYCFDTHKDVIRKTENSILYSARKVNTDNELDILKYAIKEYIGGASDEVLIAREKYISHTIENDSELSILVPILEVVEEQGTKYAIMQFRKNGMFLHEVIEALEKKYGVGNIPYGIQYDILSSLLRALDGLHNIKDRYTKKRTNGFVHMDIQPSNVFFENTQVVIDATENVTSDREVVIGTAKFIDLQSALPLKESKKGLVAIRQKDEPSFVTFGYSAPEQVHFNGYEFTQATDVYQVAAIAARMLTGVEIQFSDVSYDKLVKKMADNHAKEDESSSNFDELIMSMYKNVLLICFNTNVKYRYQTALDMLGALSNAKILYDAVVKKPRDIYRILQVAHNMCIPLDNIRLGDVSAREFTSVATALNKMTYNYAYSNNKDTVPFTPDMGLYIFRSIYKLWESKFKQAFLDKEPSNQIADVPYSLFINGGMGCYNLAGEYEEAIKLWKQLDLKRVNLEGYVKLCNRLAESYNLAFLYKNAYDANNNIVNALRAVRNIEIAQSTILGIEGSSAARDVNLGRACFNMAQFMNCYGVESVEDVKTTSVELFKEAYQVLDGNVQTKPEAYYHGLQYAIYAKDGALFNEFAKDYESTLKKNMDGLELAYGGVLPYLVYLKGLWLYISNSEFRNNCEYYSEYVTQVEGKLAVGDEVISKMLNAIESYGSLSNNIRDINLQLMYKYIGKILFYGNSSRGTLKDTAIRAMELSVNGNKYASVNGYGKLNMPSIVAYMSKHELNLMTESDDEAMESNEILFETLQHALDKSGWKNLKLLLEKVEASSCMDLCKVISYENV